MYESRVLDRLLAITAVLRADQDAALHGMGLTESRAHVLWILHRSGATKQSEIAAAMRVTPRHVTTLVDELVERDLVRRAAHPTDRRAVLVELRAGGAAIVERMSEQHRELDGLLLQSLAPSHRDRVPGDLDRLLAELVRLTEDAS